MTEVAGDLHCLACGYVADVPMEAWDECEAQKDARIAKLEAENERLKVCGNCGYWWAGLLGCEKDPDQNVSCEGYDGCKVFIQAEGSPAESCWTGRETA